MAEDDSSDFTFCQAYFSSLSFIISPQILWLQYHYYANFNMAFKKDKEMIWFPNKCHFTWLELEYIFNSTLTCTVPKLWAIKNQISVQLSLNFAF